MNSTEKDLRHQNNNLLMEQAHEEQVRGELTRQLAAEKARAAQAVAEANRRDQKWMDGINEVLGEKLEYGDPMADNCAAMALSKWAASQKARADKAEAELHKSIQNVSNVLVELAEQTGLRFKAEAACAEMRHVLGVDQPWPLIGVLNRLVMAAKHLLKGHDCDCGGYEEVVTCIEKAEHYSAVYHSLSHDYGTGWRSPEVMAKVTEALEGVLNTAVHPDKAIRSVLVPLALIREALALLKEGK